MKNLNNYLTKKEQIAVKNFGLNIVLNGTTIRPVNHISRRNYRSGKDDKLINQLANSGVFALTTGNDAPKGGVCGEFHKFTPKKQNKKLKLIIKRAEIIAQIRSDIKAQANIELLKAQEQQAAEWIRANEPKIKEYYDRKAASEYGIKGSYGSCQAINRMAFRFANEVNVGYSAMKAAMKRFFYNEFTPTANC